jgi:hypothetical protein
MQINSCAWGDNAGEAIGGDYVGFSVRDQRRIAMPRPIDQHSVLVL